MAALCMCLVFSKAHACLISTLDQKVDFHKKNFALKKTIFVDYFLQDCLFLKISYGHQLGQLFTS